MKPVIQINFLSIKPGKMEEFIESQKSYAATAKSLSMGVLGSRMYRSQDGSAVVRVTKYESIEAHKNVHQDDALKQHMKSMMPLVESTNSAVYEEVLAVGEPI
jgi:heme-degrading monooxygenase HmoA